MSASTTNTQSDDLIYTVQEVRLALSSLGHEAKSQLDGLVRFYLASKNTFGRDYFQYENKDQRMQPLGAPVADPRFNDPSFKRANTLRALTRWQSFRAGLGFRARKISEQRLYDYLELNKREHGDGIPTGAVKILRGRAIKSILADDSNIDRSRLKWIERRQDKRLEKAKKSYRQILRQFLRSRLRVKELAMTRDSCHAALELLNTLEKEGVTHLVITSKAGFRRLLVGDAKLPYSARGALDEINAYLAHDAKKSALRLQNATISPLQSPPHPPSSAPAARRAHSARDGRASSITPSVRRLDFFTLTAFTRHPALLSSRTRP